MPRDRSDEVVFVLGAGASADAGLPLAADLTRTLVTGVLKRVPSARPVIEAIDDIGGLGLLRPADAHPTDRPSGDYESFFWWLRTLLDQPPLRRKLGIDAMLPTAHEDRFKELYRDLALAIRDLITQELWFKNEAADASYLARLGDFSTDGRPTKVFTLNYDTCVERACRASGIPVVTGFDGGPTLLLGPAPKVQADDPYCVVIGFSWRDPHIAQRIGHEQLLGLDVIEVAYPVASGATERRTARAGYFETGAFKGIECKGSDALVHGHIQAALRELRAEADGARASRSFYKSP